MPNHVHFVADTSIQISTDMEINEAVEEYVEVSKWMQLIKGGSAYLINKYLKRKGTLWHKESFDHFIRFEKEGEYIRT